MRPAKRFCIRIMCLVRPKLHEAAYIRSWSTDLGPLVFSPGFGGFWGFGVSRQSWGGEGGGACHQIPLRGGLGMLETAYRQSCHRAEIVFSLESMPQTHHRQGACLHT